MIIYHTIYREDKDGYEHEINVECDVRYWPGCRGYRESGGIQLEPDEDPNCEIESVNEEQTGAVVDLTPEEEERVIEKAFKEIEDRRYDRD